MTTKTMTGPVAGAEANLAAAVQAEEAALEHDRKLREKILSSEGTVTADELAESGHAIEHAKVGTEAAQLALAGAQKVERYERLHALTEEIRELAGDPQAALAAMNAITDAVEILVAAEEARRANMTRWIGTLRREGVPEYEPDGKTRTDSQGRTKVPYKVLSPEHAGLGWKATDWGGQIIFMAGREVKHHSSGALIRAAIDRGCIRAGNRSADFLGLDHKPDERLVANPEEWIRERY